MGFLNRLQALAAGKTSSGYERSSDRTRISLKTVASSLIISAYRRPAKYLKQQGRTIKHRIIGKLDTHGRGKKQRRPNARNTAHQIEDPEVFTNVNVNTAPDRYILGRLLGEGGNGVVHLSMDIVRNKVVAIKTLRYDDFSTPPNEAHILSLIGKHDNIVGFHGLRQHPTLHQTQLVFEYCQYGDLGDYCNARAGEVPEPFLWHVFKHVAAGLAHVHRMGITHGDIKPGNIILASPRPGQPYPVPKIADFGTAIVNAPRDIPRGHHGTLGFQPPEAVYMFGPEADVWALGYVIHDLAAKCLPIKPLNYPDMDTNEWFRLTGRQIPHGTSYPEEYKFFCFYMTHHDLSPVSINRPGPYISKAYSKLLNYFMMRTLEPNYQARISSQELHTVLPVMETLVKNLEAQGQEILLSLFNDGRDSYGRTVTIVTDSLVFRDLASMIIFSADRDSNTEMLQWGLSLMPIMKPTDQVGLCRYVTELRLFSH